jgi:hypothetical protein
VAARSAVLQLTEHCHQSPDTISEAQVRGYFSYVKNERRFARGSLTIVYRAVKLFPPYRAIALLAACQSGDLGQVEWHCERCGRSHRTARSCRDRHCPGCQSSKNERWLAEQSARRLDVPYFLVTFTVPEKLRRFVRSHQRVCPQRSFAPPPALSKIYRAKFRDEMRRAGLFDAIDSGVWEEAFVTDSRAVGGGESTLRSHTRRAPATSPLRPSGIEHAFLCFSHAPNRATRRST